MAFDYIFGTKFTFISTFISSAMLYHLDKVHTPIIKKYRDNVIYIYTMVIFLTNTLAVSQWKNTPTHRSIAVLLV